MLPIHNDAETYWQPLAKRQIRTAINLIAQGNSPLAVEFLKSSIGCLETVDRINTERKKYAAESN